MFSESQDLEVKISHGQTQLVEAIGTETSSQSIFTSMNQQLGVLSQLTLNSIYDGLFSSSV